MGDYIHLKPHVPFPYQLAVVEKHEASLFLIAASRLSLLLLYSLKTHAGFLSIVASKSRLGIPPFPWAGADP